MQKILKEERNCWRLAKADRVAFLVDGIDYFAAFRDVVKQAKESILIIGWDFDSRIRLLPGDTQDELPVKLGDFLKAVVKGRSGLEAHVLIWDFAMLFALEREFVPVYKMRWNTSPRLHFRMDEKHPVGASHHQKIVVVDDAVAFVGGFDLTKSRWDTSEHRAEDARRVDPSGEHYPPFHDVQVMVDGAAAAALGELARERWRRATGDKIPVPSSQGRDRWPSAVEPQLQRVSVGIARTEPHFQGYPEIREVENLYLDAIAAARRSIYIENQYLTSAAIGEALAARLREEHGPEIVIVLPVRTSGWLEQATMDVLRARLLTKLRQADRQQRLRVFYPDALGLDGMCINVHAKVLIVDDTLVRVGSSNLSNRSLGLDTECDLAVEAGGDRRVERAIADFRNRLLAEHLGAEPERLAQTMQGSLVEVIETLRDGPRTLRALDGRVPETLNDTVPGSAVIDPEQPLDPDDLVEYFVPEEDRRISARQWIKTLSSLLVVLGLAAAWRWTPLGDWLDAEILTRSFGSLQESPWGPIIAIGGFLIGSLVVFPVSLLIVVTTLVFGPLLGAFYAWIGTGMAAVVTYAIGNVLGRDTVRRLAGRRVNRLSQRLAARGLLAVALVRMLPVAPFTVIGLVAGASHIRFQDYVLGTLIGMVPVIVVLAGFAEGLVSMIASRG